MTNQEKVKEAFNKIEEGIKNINTDQDWLHYLYFQSRFYRYSYGNVLLILFQKPNASFVKGYKAWNELGRFVKKGSKGIQILAPCISKVAVKAKTEAKDNDDETEIKDGKDKEVKTQEVIKGFRIVYVYDISDTDGSDEHLPVIIKGLSGNSEQEKDLYEKLFALISKNHNVEEVDEMSSKGSYNFETRVISIKSDLEYLQKIKTLLHEYSHLMDFDMNPSEDISRNIRELIAESVAYVVSLRLGLDTSKYSIIYIQSWLKDKNELKQIADTVQKISCKIINELGESQDFSSFNLKED